MLARIMENNLGDLTEPDNEEDSGNISPRELDVSNIKREIERLKNDSIDFSSFEEYHKEVSMILKTLNHHLSTLYKELDGQNAEEKSLRERMKQRGILNSEISSEAWRPLAKLYEKKSNILLDIRDVITVMQYADSVLVGKFFNLLKTSKGMSIAKELGDKQIELIKINTDYETQRTGKILSQQESHITRVIDLFQSSLGHIVGKLDEVNSEKIKTLKEEYAELKTRYEDINSKIKALQLENKGKDDEIERLKQESNRLKNELSFKSGRIEEHVGKYPEQSEEKKEAVSRKEIVSDSRVRAIRDELESKLGKHRTDGRGMQTTVNSLKAEHMSDQEYLAELEKFVLEIKGAKNNVSGNEEK